MYDENKSINKRNILLLLSIILILIVSLFIFKLFYNPFDNIKIELDNQSIVVGEQIRLYATLNSKEINDKSVLWISSDDSIAVIDNQGLLTAKAKGLVNISIKVDNRLGESILIEVKDEDLTNDYVNWLNKALNYAKSINLNTIVSDNSDYLAWRSSYILNGLYRAYLVTGEEVFLTKMAESLYRIYQLAKDNDGDGYLNWGAKYPKYDVGYSEYVVHAGTIVGCVADFLNLLEGKPELYNQKISTGEPLQEVASYLLDMTINHIIPGYEKDWSNQYNVYMSRKGSVNYDKSMDEIALPNNQYLTMAYGLLELSKLDIDTKIKNDYYQKASNMLKLFDSKVRRNSNGTLTWNYKDKLFEGDRPSATEDYSHGMHDIKAALAAYAEGVAFTYTDLEAFAKTYDTTMYTIVDDVPMLTMNVNGKGCDTKDNCGHIFLLLYDLSNYSDKIWERGKKYLESNENDTYADIDRLMILTYHNESPKPYSFNLTYPKANSSITGNNFLVFRWENAVRASNYTVKISLNSDMSNPVMERKNLLTTSILVSEGLEKGKTYYWQVIAKNSSGIERLSKVQSFKIE